jgi:dihydrofolate reductase
MRSLVYYVATSLDGFIAAPDGSWEFFGLSDDLAEFINGTYPEAMPTGYRRAAGTDGKPNGRFDTVLMGRGTYQPALREGVTSPYAHLKQFVFSRTLPPATEPEVEIVGSDPGEFVRALKQQDGGDIWLCGGGDLAGQLLPEVDEFLIKLNPVVIGSGIPLARRDFDPRRLTLIDNRAFGSGVVLLRYRAGTA